MITLIFACLVAQEPRMSAEFTGLKTHNEIVVRYHAPFYNGQRAQIWIKGMRFKDGKEIEMWQIVHGHQLGSRGHFRVRHGLVGHNISDQWGNTYVFQKRRQPHSNHAWFRATGPPYFFEMRDGDRVVSRLKVEK